MTEHNPIIKSGDGQYRLVPLITISDLNTEVFCVQFSPDGKFVAAGCGDGSIRVLNGTSGEVSYTLQVGSSVALPATALKFRPVSATTRTKNVLLASNASGSVQHWHMTSGKCLHSIEDPEKQVYTLDYNEDGTQFVTAGKDKCVRIYDEATKSLVVEMGNSLNYTLSKSSGHSNRIFSCKFVPGDPNSVVSGGWDNTVNIWDIRSGLSVRSFYGPHICGDSIDIFGNELLTGSWRPDNQLEIWDYETCLKSSSIPWNVSTFNQSSCMLYAAKFSKEGKGKFIAAGGSGTNEVKVFDHLNNNATVGTITGLSRGVFTLDFSPVSNKLVIGGGDATIRIFDIVTNKDS